MEALGALTSLRETPEEMEAEAEAEEDVEEVRGDCGPSKERDDRDANDEGDVTHAYKHDDRDSHEHKPTNGKNTIGQTSRLNTAGTRRGDDREKKRDGKRLKRGSTKKTERKARGVGDGRRQRGSSMRAELIDAANAVCVRAFEK